MSNYSRRFSRRHVVAIAAAVAVATGFSLAPGIQKPAFAADAPVGLGTAESFAVLGSTTVTNTDTPTVVSGNLGVSPGSSVTNFPPGLVGNGTIHRTDDVAKSAQLDLISAYDDAASRTPITGDLVDGSVSELSTRKRIGWSAGFVFWNEGGDGIPGGRPRCAAAMRCWTSCDAESMSRLKSNCSVMLVCPCELRELIEVMPEIVANCFSRGVATEEAIVSGLAPGSPAPTWIVGKSTDGRSLTGSSR